MPRALSRWFRRSRERGVIDMPSILVGLILTVSAGSIVTSIAVHANEATRSTQASTATQSQLLDGVSRVTRDIAFADPILAVRANVEDPHTDAPNGTELWTQTKRVIGETTTCLQTRYWVGPDNDADGGFALLSYTWEPQAGDCTGLPVPVWQAGDRGTVVISDLRSATDVFTYFDTNGDVLTDPAHTIDQISRVQISVFADVLDRPAGLSLTTSASPRSGLINGGLINGDPDRPTPPMIGSGAATCLDGVVTIRFPKVPDATGYTPFRDGTPQPEPVTPDGNDVVFRQTGVDTGAKHSYEMVAYGTGGYSSSTVSVTCAPAAVVLTGQTIASTNDGQPNDNLLTWAKPNGTVDGYYLYRDNDIAPLTGASLSGTSTSYTDLNLGWGSTHTYRIEPFNTDASGIRRGPGSNTVSLLLRPAAPDLRGSTSNGARTLDWNQPFSATGYELQRRYNTGTWSQWQTVPAAGDTYRAASVHYVDNDAINASPFEYRARASNASGWSPYSTVSLNPRPSGPPSIWGWTTDDGVNHIDWNSVPNTTCYVIYREDGARVQVDGGQTWFDDTGPGWGSTRYYQVTACNMTGESPRSNQVRLDQIPGPFDIVDAQVRAWGKYRDDKGGVLYDQDGGAKVGWTWSGGTDRYDVVMDGWNRFGVGMTNWSSPDFNTWTPGTIVNYQVVAIAPNGRERWSGARSVMVPPTPPSSVHASTWCKKPVNDRGWKYGMDIFAWPATGNFDGVHIIEEAFRSNGSNPDVNGYAWRTITGETYLNPSPSWGTYAWGGLPDPNGDRVISNNQYEGGAMTAETYRAGQANYGRGWSLQLQVFALKGVTGPVSCPSANTDWGYNNRPDTIHNWDAF